MTSLPNAKSCEERLTTIISDTPKLHCWDGEWCDGGLTNHMLRELFGITRWFKTSGGAIVLETGAGLSTLVFLAAEPRKLITIEPDPELIGRIKSEIARLSLCGPDHQFYTDCSENILPELAKDEVPYLDVALIDGGHGMPTVFVDFCYMNKALKQGGYLAVDDIQLHSARQLYLLLKQQPGFEISANLGKLIVFKKTADIRFLPDFLDQPFVRNNS